MQRDESDMGKVSIKSKSVRGVILVNLIRLDYEKIGQINSSREELLTMGT